MVIAGWEVGGGEPSALQSNTGNTITKSRSSRGGFSRSGAGDEVMYIRVDHEAPFEEDPFEGARCKFRVKFRWRLHDMLKLECAVVVADT